MLDLNLVIAQLFILNLSFGKPRPCGAVPAVAAVSGQCLQSHVPADCAVVPNP